MQLHINDMTPETFLAEYWQKKPLVIRQGFKNFEDLLTPEEMAGLATNEMVESRRVSNKGGVWDAEFGPFESHEHLGDSEWTLIVQALNNWLPQSEALIQCFDFIPRWRLDDLMVSYGLPGGGVGPHIDLYDVFICQGSGSRRWRVGKKEGNTEFVAHPALLHVEQFEPILDIELNTGDILYLPSGYPHDGISLEPSMSFSVGYRTASSKEMFSALADHIIDSGQGEQRIDDPDRPMSKHSGLIDNQDFNRIKEQMLSTMNDALISEFTGRFLTNSKCELDLPEQKFEFQIEDVLTQLEQQPLIRMGGLRCLYFENSYEQGIVYINGEQVILPHTLVSLIPRLCNLQELTNEVLANYLGNSDFQLLITDWVNCGYWYFDA